MKRLFIDYLWSYLAVGFGLTLISLLIVRMGWSGDGLPAQTVLTAIGAVGIVAHLHTGRGGGPLPAREAWAFALFTTGVVAGLLALRLALMAQQVADAPPVLVLSALGFELLVHFVLVRLFINNAIAGEQRRRAKRAEKKG